MLLSCSRRLPNDSAELLDVTLQETGRAVCGGYSNGFGLQLKWPRTVLAGGLLDTTVLSGQQPKTQAHSWHTGKNLDPVTVGQPAGASLIAFTASLASLMIARRPSAAA
jgi:hypothetical protein